MDIIRSILLSSVAGFLMINQVSAMPIVVTTEEAFLDIVGDVVIQTETFPNAIAGDVEIIFEDTGVVSTAVGGNPVFNEDNAVLGTDTGPSDGLGEYFTAIGPSGVSPTTITWLFPTEIVGFFGDFESATFVQFDVLDAMNNVLRTVRISDFIPAPQFGSSDGTLGVTSLDNPFNRIRFSAIPGVNFELFGLNSFQFTDGTPLPPSTPSEVPSPSAMSLFVLGLLSLVYCRRRQLNKN